MYFLFSVDFYRKKKTFLSEKCAPFSHLRSSTYSLPALSETDNTRRESQSQRRIYHVYVKVVCKFLSFSPSRGDICAH